METNPYPQTRGDSTGNQGELFLVCSSRRRVLELTFLPTSRQILLRNVPVRHGVLLLLPVTCIVKLPSYVPELCEDGREERVFAEGLKARIG